MKLIQRIRNSAPASDYALAEVVNEVLDRVAKVQDRVDAAITLQITQVEKFEALVDTLNSYSAQDYQFKQAIKTALSPLYSQVYFSK